MKKIILILFFILISIKANDTYALINEYINIEKELNIKLQNNNEDFKKELQEKQNKILNQIPSLISKQKINENLINNFLKNKNNISKELNNKKQDFNFINTNYKYLNLKLDEEFYKILFNIQKLFINLENSEEFKKISQNGIESLHKIIQNDFEKIYKNFNEIEKTKSLNLQKDLELKLQAYNKILSYIYDNADFFENNIFLSEFKLQNIIDKINNIMPQFAHINIAKIIITLAIILCFYILKLFLPLIFFTILIKISYKNILNTKEVKEIFISKSRRSFDMIILCYTINTCLALFYFPAPLSIVIIDVFYVIYAILLSWFIIEILNSYGIVLLSKIAQKSGKKEIANLIIKILYFIVIIIAILFVLAKLGFNINAIIASLGIGGLAVALAAKDIIANFFASIIVSFDNSLNQGDTIEINGIEGSIVETGLRKTTIRTADNALIYIPNSNIMNANIKNWSKRKVGRQVKIILAINYEATIEQLKKCIKDLQNYLDNSPLIAHENDNALNNNDHRIKYRQNLVSINDLEGYKNSCYVSLESFGDNSINIELYFYTKTIITKEFKEVKQNLLFDFMNIIKDNNLSFVSPSLNVNIQKLPKI